ncbi:MAG: di-trans,poly-cis-decaprenylcistransferase [Pseudomonadota bacterium]|jgi:undecaprenyl diphosphate synthase
MSVCPSHVAIVMDGNGRWAAKRFLPRIAGHKRGIDALRKVAKACADRGVDVLTVFAFSSENWSRPAEEVSGLMDLLVFAVSREVPKLNAEGVRIYFVGNREALSTKVQAVLAEAEATTAVNSRLILNICFNYGGRWDIVQAAQRVAAAGQEVTEKNLSAHLALGHVCDPDLVIRTGGEFRISNFLLWQSAYAEFVFSDRLWPEFHERDLDAAIASYGQRERRFGKTSAQLTGEDCQETH